VHFEKGDHEECIKDCDAAVERGRELRADYKTVAKALTRKGTSLVKQGKLGDAIDTYQKALTEHRSGASSLWLSYLIEINPILRWLCVHANSCLAWWGPELSSRHHLPQ